MLDVVVLPWVPVTAIVGAQPGELAEQLGAVQLALRRARAPATRSGLSAGIAVETHDLGAARHVVGGVAGGRRDAGGAQARGVRRAGGAVGARDRGAERVRDERQPAHAGAADPHEVQPAAGPGLRGVTAGHPR